MCLVGCCAKTVQVLSDSSSSHILIADPVPGKISHNTLCCVSWLKQLQSTSATNKKLMNYTTLAKPHHHMHHRGQGFTGVCHNASSTFKSCTVPNTIVINTPQNSKTVVQPSNMNIQESPKQPMVVTNIGCSIINHILEMYRRIHCVHSCCKLPQVYNRCVGYHSILCVHPSARYIGIIISMGQDIKCTYTMQDLA